MEGKKTMSEARKAYHREYYRQYRKDKPWVVRAAEKKYIETHREYARAKSKARKRKYREALPKCLNNTQIRKVIREIYLNCPHGYQVDHIVPLNGATVSGLHVPWNLQYLTIEENIRKGNKYE